MFTIDEAVRLMRERPEYARPRARLLSGPRRGLDSYAGLRPLSEFGRVRRALEGAGRCDPRRNRGGSGRGHRDRLARLPRRWRTPRLCRSSPIPSDEVGQGVIRRLRLGPSRWTSSRSYGERIPLATVRWTSSTRGRCYITRATSMRRSRSARECFVREDIFIACREHVVRTDAELRGVSRGSSRASARGRRERLHAGAVRAGARRARAGRAADARTLGLGDQRLSCGAKRRGARETSQAPPLTRFRAAGRTRRTHCRSSRDIIWARIRPSRRPARCTASSRARRAARPPAVAAAVHITGQPTARARRLPRYEASPRVRRCR